METTPRRDVDVQSRPPRYAHCGREKGSIVLLIVNAATKRARRVALPFGFADLPRNEWHVTAPPRLDDGGPRVFGRTALLNGIPLLKTDQPLPGVAVDGGPVVVEPASYAFVVVPDARWGPCV